ncbi:hypothetical protein [Snodgrassella alvi]|nr:hypothetical protein [Snodgrassella alvi]
MNTQNRQHKAGIIPHTANMLIHCLLSEYDFSAYSQLLERKYTSVLPDN